MSSETITRNDLKNILDELGLGAFPFSTNHTFDVKFTEGTAITVSNQTPQKVFSINHTSQTGQILCIGRLYLQTSTKTSRGRLFIDENNVDTVTTNSTTDKEQTLFYVANVTKEEHEISLRVSTQDTSTTGTVPAYRTLGLLAVDLPKEQYIGSPSPPFIPDWEDISSEFTVNSTYVVAFKAYTNGKMVAFRITSIGAPDQTSLVTATPLEYRCVFDYYAVPCFFMNATDFTRNTNVAVMSNGTIQIRCSSASQGTGGVQIGGMYPIA